MSYGDGTIYQRADGRWVAKYVPRAGSKAKYIYAKSEAEVKKKLRQFKQSPEIAVQISPQKVTLTEYIQNWLDTYKRPTLKPSSYDRTESVLRGTISPRIGDKLIGEITSLDCQTFINELVDEGKSYSVIKKAYDLLHSCFDFAVTNKDISSSPMKVVSAPTRVNFERKDTRSLTEEEERRLLKELEKRFVSSKLPVYNYRYAYILYLNTGMRLGEGVALDWSDVDFDAKTISVNKTAIMVRTRDSEHKASGKQEQVIQATPKTKSGNRIIPLNKTALNALRHLQKAAGESEHVINTKNGTRPLCNGLLKQLLIAYRECGITNAGVHTLRHTFATRLFERGASLKDVSSILGHSSIAITANTYVHVLNEKRHSVVELLESKNDEKAE